MHTCIVCTNSSPRTKHIGGVTYHSIPKNQIRQKRWLRSLKLKKATNWHRVCSFHFTDEDYVVRDGCKRTLLKSAVPSLKIFANQNNNPKPKFVALLRNSLLPRRTVESELIYPEDPINPRGTRTDILQTQNKLENTVEKMEHKIEETGMQTEQTVDNTVVQTVELPMPKVEYTQVMTMEQSQHTEEQTVEDTEQKTVNQTVNNSIITPRRSTRKIKIKKNDDEIENNSLAQSRKNNVRVQTIPTSLNKKKKNTSHGMKCFVKNCQTEYMKNSVSFFGFPRDPSVRKLWMNLCQAHGSVKPMGKLKSNIKICRKHFENSMFLHPDNPKRLRPTAFPTIFLNDVSTDGTLESSDSDDGSIDEYPPEYYTDLDKLYDRCSIPNCDVDDDEYTDHIGSRTFFTLGNKCKAIEWGLANGIELTPFSPVCSRHYRAVKENENVLDANFTSIMLGTSRTASKRSITNNDNDDLTIKKKKKNFFDESKTTVHFENKDIKYIDKSTLLSNTKPKDSSPNSDEPITYTRSSTKRKMFKLLNFRGSGTPVYHVPDEPTEAPGDLLTDSASITSSSDDAIPISLQSTFENIMSKTRPNDVSVNFEKNISPDKNTSLKVLPKNNVPNTLKSSISQSDEQVSAIDSTRTINSTVDENYISVSIKPEPNDDPIPNDPSDSCVYVSYRDSPGFQRCLPLNSHQDTAILTSKSCQSHDQHDKLTDSNMNIKSEPIDASDEECQTNQIEDLSDNLQSNVESTTLAVNHMTDILQKNTNKSMSRISTQTSSTDDSTKKVDSSFNFKSKLNTRPTDVLPSTSVNNLIANNGSSKLKELLLNGPSNGSVSITLNSGHQLNVSNASDNYSMVKTSQSNFHQNDQKSAVHSKVDQLSNELNLPEFINKQVTIIKTGLPKDKDESPEIVNFHSLNVHSINSNKNESNNVFHPIFKKTKLPHNLWRLFVHIKNGTKKFVQLDETMVPIKKVIFDKSLVPDIYVNGKSFECYDEIRNENQMENLLGKIDEIEICWGYNGLHHEKCIAYFEDTTEESLECHYCKGLTTADNVNSEDIILKNKSIMIKNLHKEIFELEAKVLQATQNQKKEGLDNILKTINPFKALKTLKPPAYSY